MRMQTLMPAPQVRQARLQLVEQGIAPQGAVDARLVNSWQRSLQAGLSPVGRIHCLDNLAGLELTRARTSNHDLIRHSEPVMEYLFDQVRQSHSMVILADPRGVLMHTLGDLDFLSKAERVALTCGATWAENQRGTNAIGTALAEGHEIEIHGAEHYLERNGFLTCAAAPILSARGQFMGILDISGDHRNRHPHTLGLVSTAARMIENSMVLAASRHQIVLQMHARAEGIGSVAQAVLVFDDAGALVGANRCALSMLGLRHPDLGAMSWEQMFEGRFETLVAAARKAGARPVLVRTHAGVILHAQLHGTTPRQAPHIVPAVPRTSDALAQLDTGDTRWRHAAERARRVVDKSIALLVRGESGVGKELFARAVHHSSRRRDQPFVAINCAALPEHLIEAELFGYAPGAFTGAARQGAPGRLREAHGGTVFLDEIGDMPATLQTRLLRVLQERQVTPLGSGVSIPVDFNLICATHCDLDQAVEQGSFRADLYYRINGLTVQLPALREREDFAELTVRLLADIEPDAGLRVDPEVQAALARYPWPGNLRQYSHVLRVSAALLDPDETVLSWQHLPEDLLTRLQAGTATAAMQRPPQNLHELSQRAVDQALENTRGNVSAAARQLGISRQTLYRRLNEREGTGSLSAR